jgi:putative transposase
MPNYRRNYVPGGTYFFTLVTHHRRPFLTTDLARDCLRNALEDELTARPFQKFAIVLLPDHLHAIWTLPPGDAEYSVRWEKIKSDFTRTYLKRGGIDGAPSTSRLRHRERSVWQRRFWEHTCRDEDDLKRFLDYLHGNPVKHGLATRVRDDPWSTFRKFVKMGEYPLDWGAKDPCPGFHTPERE